MVVSTEGMWTWVGRMVVLTRPWVVFVERTWGSMGSWLYVRNWQGCCKRLTTSDSLHMVFGRKG